MKRISVAATTLALLALAACGNPVGGSDAAPTPRSVTASADPDVTPSPSATTDSYRLPSGMRLITAKESGVRFAVPRSWTILDSTRLADPSNRTEMGEFAAGMNLTLTQFRQMLDQIDVMAMSSATTRAGYGEVNVVPVSALGEIPTREAIREQFKALNFAVLGFREVRTPVGSGLVVETRRLASGDLPAYGGGVFVETEDGIVNLTVTAFSRASVNKLLDGMLPSLQPV